jgi:hypothetical protein
MSMTVLLCACKVQSTAPDLGSQILIGCWLSWKFKSKQILIINNHWKLKHVPRYLLAPNCSGNQNKLSFNCLIHVIKWSICWLSWKSKQVFEPPTGLPPGWKGLRETNLAATLCLFNKCHKHHFYRWLTQNQIKRTNGGTYLEHLSASGSLWASIPWVNTFKINEPWYHFGFISLIFSTN